MPVPVRELRRRLVELWRACDGKASPPARTFTAGERSANERRLAGFVDMLRAEAGRPPAVPGEAAAVRERLVRSGSALARAALGWEKEHLDLVLSGGFERPAREFAVTARTFGPGLSDADVLQATRNVWVANGLQMLFGSPVALTPAITAYSLLYPHTDNLLDDPKVPGEVKRDFNARLKARLDGHPAEPANAGERTVFDLVAMIESQYHRARHPGVFESLRAIHAAQVESLGLLRPGASPFEADVLGITLDKGGTSVLADAYLVAGALDPARAEFAYGLGALLQLMDDLEDVNEDQRDGRMTLFTQTSRGWPLDGITDHVLRFGERVLSPLDAVAAPGTEALRDLVRSVTRMGLVDCAGRARRLYSRGYIARLEERAPFRFAFAARQRKKLAKHGAAIRRLFQAMAQAAH